DYIRDEAHLRPLVVLEDVLGDQRMQAEPPRDRVEQLGAWVGQVDPGGAALRGHEPAEMVDVGRLLDGAFVPAPNPDAHGRRVGHDHAMTRGRLEAFSDGVIAILITIMVLELVAPHGAELQDLVPLGPVFIAYVLSFANLAIYWNNHHHLLQAAKTVSGRVLWANMLLLFFLSLMPFGTAWMGENHFAAMPVALYGVICILAAFSYGFLVRALMAAPGQSSTLAEALGDDFKGRISPVLYGAAIPIALVAPLIAFGVYVFVAAMWIVPDPRIERRITA